MLPLFIPWLLLALLVVAVVLLLFRKWRIAVGVFFFMVAANWYFEVYPIHFNWSDNGGRTLKVMTWNIDGSSADISSKIGSIANVILKEDPDLVFVAEDHYVCCEQLDSLLKEKYPYTTHRVCNEIHYFYSKNPVGEGEWIAMDVDPVSCIIKSSLFVDGSKIELYGCHLSSNNYSSSDNLRPENIETSGDLYSYLKGVEKASDYRLQEACVIVDSIGDSNLPTIILGDMNDVSGSSALNTFESVGFSDAWWRGGCGYGATIHHPLPFRIDHILYNDGLKLKNIKKIKAYGLSDHDALVAAFEIK